MGTVWRLTDHGAAALAVGGPHDLRGVAWRHDGTQALCCGNRGVLARLFDADVTPMATGTREGLRGVAYRPDGDLALAVGNAGALVEVGETVRATPLPSPVNLRRVAWHPSGRFALIVGNDGLALRWQGGRAWGVGWGHRHLRALDWRPDGAFALIAANGGLYRFDEDGDDLALLSDLPDGDYAGVAWNDSSTAALLVGYRQSGPAVTDRETVAVVTDAEGVVVQAAFPPVASHALTHVASRPGAGQWWFVQGPAYGDGDSVVFVWDGTRLPRPQFSCRARLGPLVWDPAGGVALVVESPRTPFYRA